MTATLLLALYMTKLERSSDAPNKYDFLTFLAWMLFGFVAMGSLLSSCGSEGSEEDYGPLAHQRELRDQQTMRDVWRQNEQQNAQNAQNALYQAQ